MLEREWGRFMVDVQRFRPLITLVMVAIAMLPSLDALLTHGLAPFEVLVRLAETMLVMNFVTWCGARIVTKYARIQAQQELLAKGAEPAMWSKKLES